MTDEKKVAATGAASKNSEKPSPAVKKTKVEKEEKPKNEDKKDKKFNNPFSEQDPLQAKLVNMLMRSGKKTIARRVLRDTFEEMHRRGEKDPLKALEKALQNATPTMEVKPRRVGGSIYQIPIEVTPKRQESLPLRWILAGARSKKGQPMYRRLAGELLDAASEQGFAFNKKMEVHKMAQSNKAFAHLARY
ncbi:30S ribosomal protein S7 [bacterium]|jgi:small subunit ribosomal protein S7|nr:30S ribosomal protein S7 [bacterium]MBT6831759.1 30S ribosomal protein S7 [bacterium]MBT6996582.1 30S ribosomal protein S7 [bacterium]MBT7772908.1 30S ribosomal protein S7 [bacterium]